MESFIVGIALWASWVQNNQFFFQKIMWTVTPPPKKNKLNVGQQLKSKVFFLGGSHFFTKEYRTIDYRRVFCPFFLQVSDFFSPKRAQTMRYTKDLDWNPKFFFPHINDFLHSEIFCRGWSGSVSGFEIMNSKRLLEKSPQKSVYKTSFQWLTQRIANLSSNFRGSTCLVGKNQVPGKLSALFLRQ